MITNPTPAQERAMQLTGCNLIVSAAAGSGKTAVMVDRAVRSLADGQDLSRLLMVTFTNAAAAQMKQRIAKELAAAVQAAEGAQKAHLRRQLSMVHSSEITTIDSFCLHLVRRYFHLVDIDPLFSLCGPAEQTILISQALDDVLDACFDESAHGFLCALEALCGGDEAQLRALIARVYQFARTSDDPGAWAARARSFYDGRGATEQAVSLLKEDLQSQLHAFAAQALTAADALDARLIGTQKPPAMQKSLRTAAQQAQMCLSLSPGPALSDALRAIRFPAMALRNAGGLGEAEFAPVRAAVQQARETLSRMQDHLLLHAGEQGCMQMLCSMREPVHALLDLVDQFAQVYTAKKRERNLLDFADLEHLALQILRDPQAQKEVQQRYECVYIDEYQDTNDLQEALLTRVARPGALFCVGDVKQSIYAFRHAEPALFIRRYEQSAPDAPQCDKPQAPDVRIDLNQNFRSTRTLIDCINAVFARAMSREVGGLAYDETQALQAGLDTDGDPVRFILLQTDGQESKALQTDGAQEQALPQSAIERTATVIAQRVHELLRTERVPGDADSHYRYSDIAILCRALGTDGPALLTALTAQGIPVSSNLSGGVLQAQETGAMLSLLRAIDNARDDLAMLGALRSPAALCTAQDLARIRIQSDEPFALAVAQYAENGEGESADRIRAFWKQFTAWRALSRQVTVDELLTDIFEQTDALSYYALQPGGAQKVENLQALWMSAQSFSALGDGSLYGFLQMLQLHQQLGVDEMPAPAKGEDAVQLMTIHASKGLEFPAVIVPFLQKRFRFSSDAVCLSKAFGLGVKTYDFATQTVQDGPAAKAPAGIERGITGVLRGAHARQSVADTDRPGGGGCIGRTRQPCARGRDVCAGLAAAGAGATARRTGTVSVYGAGAADALGTRTLAGGHCPGVGSPGSFRGTVP